MACLLCRRRAHQLEDGQASQNVFAKAQGGSRWGGEAERKGQPAGVMTNRFSALRRRGIDLRALVTRLSQYRRVYFG